MVYLPNTLHDFLLEQKSCWKYITCSQACISALNVWTLGSHPLTRMSCCTPRARFHLPGNTDCSSFRFSWKRNTVVYVCSTLLQLLRWWLNSIIALIEAHELLHAEGTVPLARKHKLSKFPFQVETYHCGLDHKYT